MSAIATFTLLPTSLTNDLRDAAVPKVLLGKQDDGFHRFLTEKGREVAEYPWSGYVIATLLPYLEQEWDITFTNSDFDDLETFISNVRDNSSFVLIHSHREKYLEELDPSGFSEEELKDYFEEFNETTFQDAGKAMLDGIVILHRSLSEIDAESFVLLMIG